MQNAPEPFRTADERLQALRDTGLLDSPPERAFERLTEFARQMLKVPVALISVVDDRRQFFKSSQGLPEPWASRREAPLSHSFCKYVLSSKEPLMIRDARDDPRFSKSLAIPELGAVAYLGVPLLTPEGHVIGSLCAIDNSPRDWSDNDVEVLSELAAVATAEIALHLHLQGQQSAQDRLRESEALKSAILDAALDSIITVDAESRIIEWNSAAERTFGYSRSAVIGRDLADLIIPPRYHQAHRNGMARYLATGHGPVLRKRVELEARRSDGSEFPVELAISDIDIRGAARFTAYLRDISERKQAELALRDSEQRLNATYQHAFVGISEVDIEGHFLRVNEALCEMTGYSREELLSRTFLDLTHPDDRQNDREQFDRQTTGDQDNYILEKRYVRKNGEVLWVELSAAMVYGVEGQPLYGVRVVRDISDRKRAEMHQKILINELNHRVKNTLAVVQSVVDLTLRNERDPKQARKSIQQRLMALASAHDVLTRESWESADLMEIARQAFAPFEGSTRERVQISGPNLRLSPRIALSLSMAFHELATNAVKYGALSVDTGTIEINWAVEQLEQKPRLLLRWTESGGPVVEPPKQRGFGTRLIEGSLAQGLQGHAHIQFTPQGVVCTIAVPLANIDAPTPAHAREAEAVPSPRLAST